jgi:imidazolonepropionase-like amidohydrolase
MRMTIALASVVVLLAAPDGAQPPAAVTRALTGVTIVDGTGAPARPGMTLVLRDGRIADIHADGAKPLPEGIDVMRLDGRTVIPGLIEAHTHLQDFFESRERLTSELERMLYGGVVAIREMAADARVSGELNRAARLGQIAGPDIYFAAVMMGPTFRGLDPNGAAIARAANDRAGWIQTATPDMDIPLAVARAAGSGATALKLYIEMEPDLVAAITREAHRQGLKVWAHPAVFPSRPIDVVRAGVDGISHTCGLAWQDADLEPRQFAKVSRTNRPSFDTALVQPDSAEMQELFAELVKRGTLFDPTFSMYPGRKSPFGCAPELMTALARAASRAGVAMLAGTDWHAPPDEPLPSLHAEIIALVEHEVLAPAQAIAAATRNGARALGIENDTGTIEVGKSGDVVVLDGNPLDDIRNVRRIHSVLKRGAWYPRGEFDRRRTGVVAK